MKQKFKSLFDKFVFGKFKGEILDNVYEKDKGYVIWCYENNIIDFEDELLDRLKL